MIVRAYSSADAYLVLAFMTQHTDYVPTSVMSAATILDNIQFFVDDCLQESVPDIRIIGVDDKDRREACAYMSAFDSRDGAWHIKCLFVKDGTGSDRIASQMLSWMVRQIRGKSRMNELSVSVCPQDIRAMDFWAREGFEKNIERTRTYRDEDLDLIALEKRM